MKKEFLLFHLWKKYGVLSIFILGMCITASAQNRLSITGIVVDSLDATPLPGVTVMVQGTPNGMQTDLNGRFTIKVDPGAVLIFNFIGYRKQKVEVKDQTQLKVRLTPSAQDIKEVVVVAYGQQKKVSVTGAISSVGRKDLLQSSSASIANSLAGRLPGLTSIQSGGGQPGRDDATMYLRGAATTNGQNPLILIDGVPRDNIRTIDANEVESITVLKDASATAVFGVRGANGVILITTRRGTEGATDLSVNIEQSASSFTREPERLHSLDYMALRNEAAKNDGIATPPFSSAIMAKYANPLAGLDPKDPNYSQKASILNYMYPDHDYYREYISKYSPQTKVDLNASGGTSKVSYFINADYLHQGGNLNTESPSVLGYDPSSWMNRFSFRSNLDYKISKSFKSFLNIASYIEQVNMPAAWLYGGDTNWMMRDVLYQAQTILPITPGPRTIDGFGVAPGQIVDPGYLDRSAFEIMNRMGYRNEVRSNLNTSLGMDWDLGKAVTKGLSIRGMMSYDSRSTTAMQAGKSERLYLANVNAATDQLSYAVKRGNETLLSLTKADDSRYKINIQSAINYNRNFGGKHDVGAMILGQRDYWETTAGEIPYNVLGAAGRFTYGFDNRYLAEIDMGYNGSEQFAPGNRYGFFPAASVGWVISNEQFLKNSDILTSLKLRASYGIVGNDQIGAARFLYQSNIQLGAGPLSSLGNGQGVNQGLLGNPNITWEKARKQNYGADLQLFKNLDATFDYFIENRSDILISRGSVPVFQGVPLSNIPKANLGRVDNQGYEISLAYNKLLTRDLSFSFKGNYAYNHNIVKFIDEPISDDSYAYRYRTTGFSLGQQWGYKIDYSNGNGYFNSQKELDSYLAKTTYGFGSPRVGDFKYVDLNGDGVINNKDLAPIGYSSIPSVTYGLQLSVKYRAFELTTFFQGVGKYSSTYSQQGVYEYIGQGTYFDYQRNAWTAERYANGDKITYPELSTHSTTNHVANDFFIMDRSFIRLKNVALAYTLPGKALKYIGVQKLRVYLSGQNLYTWDHLRMGHLDPENNDPLGYPVTRMMTFGVNAGF